MAFCILEIFYDFVYFNRLTSIWFLFQLFKLGSFQSLCISEASEINNERSYSRAITIRFRNEEECSAFNYSFEIWKKVVLQGSSLPNGTVSSSTSKFDDKIEASSAKMYFHYYGQLLHQQNMLQDYVRTGYIYELKFILSLLLRA